MGKMQRSIRKGQRTMIAVGIVVAVFACARKFDVLWRYGLWSMDQGTYILLGTDFRVWTYGRMDPRSLQIQAKMGQGEPRGCHFGSKWTPCGHQIEPCWHQIVPSCSKLAPSWLLGASLVPPWCLPGATLTVAPPPWTPKHWQKYVLVP